MTLRPAPRIDGAAPVGLVGSDCAAPLVGGLVTDRCAGPGVIGVKLGDGATAASGMRDDGTSGASFGAGVVFVERGVATGAAAGACAGSFPLPLFTGVCATLREAALGVVGTDLAGFALALGDVGWASAVAAPPAPSLAPLRRNIRFCLLSDMPLGMRRRRRRSSDCERPCEGGVVAGVAGVVGALGAFVLSPPRAASACSAGTGGTGGA